MNALTKALLGSVAISALAFVPAMAQSRHAAMHITALPTMHAGRIVNKTKIHNQGATHLTYTFDVYNYLSGWKVHKTVPLPGSFWKWNSNNTACSQPRQKLKLPKKTQYAKLSVITETYSLGCESGPAVYLGIGYKANSDAHEGAVDYFAASYIGWFRNNSTKYKGTMNLDVVLTLE